MTLLTLEIEKHLYQTSLLTPINTQNISFYIYILYPPFLTLTSIKLPPQKKTKKTPKKPKQIQNKTKLVKLNKRPGSLFGDLR